MSSATSEIYRLACLQAKTVNSLVIGRSPTIEGTRSVTRWESTANSKRNAKRYETVSTANGKRTAKRMPE